MTEGMLTRTSHITALAAKAIRGCFQNCGRMPRIVSVPGRATAFFRMQWNLLGLLARSDKRLLDENGELRHKSEIRNISHMHHAVDAVTLGLAAALLPVDGAFWAVACKRRVSPAEADALRTTGLFRFSAQRAPHLVDIPAPLEDSIARAFGENRVVVHQPQTRRGMKVQQNTWGVVKVEGDYVTIRQRGEKPKKVRKAAVFGLNPQKGRGKLKALKGVLQRDGNFGAVLAPVPTVIPVFKVWKTIGGLTGKGRIPILRNGDIISVPKGTYKGVWRVKSVKNNDGGIALDIVVPYAIKAVSGSPCSRVNAALATMLRDGMKVLEPRYTGIRLCPTTSSTSPNPAPSSP